MEENNTNQTENKFTQTKYFKFIVAVIIVIIAIIILESILSGNNNQENDTAKKKEEAPGLQKLDKSPSKRLKESVSKTPTEIKDYTIFLYGKLYKSNNKTNKIINSYIEHLQNTIKNSKKISSINKPDAQQKLINYKQDIVRKIPQKKFKDKQKISSLLSNTRSLLIMNLVKKQKAVSSLKKFIKNSGESDYNDFMVQLDKAKTCFSHASENIKQAMKELNIETTAYKTETIKIKKFNKSSFEN